MSSKWRLRVQRWVWSEPWQLSELSKSVFYCCDFNFSFAWGGMCWLPKYGLSISELLLRQSKVHMVHKSQCFLNNFFKFIIFIKSTQNTKCSETQKQKTSLSIKTITEIFYCMKNKLFDPWPLQHHKHSEQDSLLHFIYLGLENDFAKGIKLFHWSHLFFKCLA